MRISLEWLSQYVDLSGLTPETIAEALTRSGLEVEAVEYEGPKFDGVIVARVDQVDPHPNADKLRLVTVNRGPEKGNIQVVCGAPNVKQGQRIAFAEVGASVFSRKENKPFVLGEATIRGVKSCGMVCSLEELGLEEQYAMPEGESGIWPINSLVSDEQLGQSLKQVLGLNADVILETAPTANRGDLMSHLGVAREVAALFQREVKLSEGLSTAGQPSNSLPVKVSLSDNEICRYYGGLLLDNVQIKPSPDWLQNRLRAAGVRPINNVVDITNYVMMEIGQPMHAFDRDKLGDAGAIDVRRARDGETIKTLDDAEYTLTSEAVLVTYNDTPVALGGVMGGSESAISDGTTRILLESAYFPPASNRRSARSVGIRTDSSARFERGVDLATSRKALFRAAQLLKELADATVTGWVESPYEETAPADLTLRLSRLERVLGMSFDAETVSGILRRLGFEILPGATAEVIPVRVPSFRQQDVSKEIDLIEEVIRIYGYDQVPYTLPEKTAASGLSLRQRMLDGLRNLLCGAGLQEVSTASLIGPEILQRTGFSIDESQCVRVNNSHSEEHCLMRQSLLPTLVEVVRTNLAQGLESVWAFELGRVYFKRGKASFKQSGVQEKLLLAGVVTGSPAPSRWQKLPVTDFYRAKGIVESMLQAFPLTAEVAFEPDTTQAAFHPGRCAKIKLGGKDFGMIGELHPATAQELKFRQPVYLFQLNVDWLYKALEKPGTSAEPRTVQVSPYPAMQRDMAFAAPVTLHHQAVVQTLREEKADIIQDVELFDEYRGSQLGEGQRSLAYRLTFQSDERTLTDAEVDSLMKRLKERLTDVHGVQFR
jgi:phenylalanyl-tRNA synthetase beta chain